MSVGLEVGRGVTVGILPVDPDATKIGVGATIPGVEISSLLTHESIKNTLDRLIKLTGQKPFVFLFNGFRIVTVKSPSTI